MPVLLSVARMNILMISLTISGIKANNITISQSIMLKFCTLKASARKGTEITPICRIKPMMMAPMRYLLEKIPIWNMDLYSFLIDKE